MTSLQDSYQKAVASGEIIADSQQLSVLAKFEELYQALTTKKLFAWRQEAPKGLYLWGSVGIGKTFLMNLFYHALPFSEKLRTHFLPFMQQVHAELRDLQGTKNPLQKIAKNWAEKTRVICFDELIVNDIADAMLLGGLLDALFQQGICVCFTANLPPDRLYENGLQRELFLPTIDHIKAHTDVIHLTMTDDYRTVPGRTNRYYHYPLTTAARDQLQQDFMAFSQGDTAQQAPLVICDRPIAVIKQAGKVAWFDFLTICNVPRGADDYLAIAQQFETVIVSNIIAIGANESNMARCFIQLVDVFYDAKTRLIISAALPIDQLYPAGQLVFEFARTRSRLTQMQSADWPSEL